MNRDESKDEQCQGSSSFVNTIIPEESWSAVGLDETTSVADTIGERLDRYMFSGFKVPC